LRLVPTHGEAAEEHSTALAAATGQKSALHQWRGRRPGVDAGPAWPLSSPQAPRLRVTPHSVRSPRCLIPRPRAPWRPARQSPSSRVSPKLTCSQAPALLLCGVAVELLLRVRTRPPRGSFDPTPPAATAPSRLVPDARQRAALEARMQGGYVADDAVSFLVTAARNSRVRWQRSIGRASATGSLPHRAVCPLIPVPRRAVRQTASSLASRLFPYYHLARRIAGTRGRRVPGLAVAHDARCGAQWLGRRCGRTDR